MDIFSFILFIYTRELESETSTDKTFLSFINFEMSFDVMFKFQT